MKRTSLLQLPVSVPRRHTAAALRLAALLVAILQSAPGPVLADWPPGGVQLCQSCQGLVPVVVSDGTGGGFIVWQESRNGNSDIYAQHVTASGDLAPGWPIDGVPLCTSPREQMMGGHGVSDGAGGFIVPWNDYRDFVPGGTLEDIYAQRVLADGSIAPGWPVDGLAVRRAPSRDDTPVLIADGAGGAFFSWYDQTNYDIYLQRITGTGEVEPGWLADALPVCTLPSGQGNPHLTSDGAGGVFMVWGDFRDGPLAIYAQRVTGDGQIAPGWPAKGVRIVLGRAIRGLVPDGLGGAYVAASATTTLFNDEDYYLHRFLGAGTIAPGWPEGGVPVCLAPDERNSLRMIPDGAGGALLAWADYRASLGDEIFALRVQPDGSRYPGWPVDGLRVTDDTALDDVPDLASDGMGGAYLAWDHYTTGADRVRVQHLSGAGTVAPGWPSGGAEIPSTALTGRMRVVEDGMGGALVVWPRADQRIMALRYNADGPVPVAVAMVSAEAEPERVRLTWYAGDGTSLVATVERRIEAEDWQALGTVIADGTGKLTYEDRSVSAGTRYAYRLGYADGVAVAHTAEAWVTVPALVLALRGLTPNPSAGDPMVAFTLASGEPASLELFDVHGRLVLSHEAGSLGPGSHTVRLEARGRLAAGVYTVRLRQGSQVASARAVIIR